MITPLHFGRIYIIPNASFHDCKMDVLIDEQDGKGAAAQLPAQVVQTYLSELTGDPTIKEETQTEATWDRYPLSGDRFLLVTDYKQRDRSGYETARTENDRSVPGFIRQRIDSVVSSWAFTEAVKEIRQQRGFQRMFDSYNAIADSLREDLAMMAAIEAEVRTTWVEDFVHWRKTGKMPKIFSPIEAWQRHGRVFQPRKKRGEPNRPQPVTTIGGNLGERTLFPIGALN